MVNIPNKPVVAMSDEELKCLAYDFYQERDIIDKNLNLITAELNRRKEKVLSSVSEKDFLKMIDNVNK